MVSVTFISTLFAVAGIANASMHKHRASFHHNVDLRAIQEQAAELEHAAVAAEHKKVPRNKLSKRCKAPSSSLVISSAYSTSTSTSTSTSSSSSSSWTSSSLSSSTWSSTSSTIVVIPTSTTVAPTTTEAKTTSSSSSSTSTSTSSAPSSTSTSGHKFTITNQCSYSVSPKVADTSCGYSPRCPAANYAASQPGTLASGQSETIYIPSGWVGRIFNQDGSCGSSGEDCTMLEFNLDADSIYTPQSYDISNIQGFTQSISVGADGCDTVTCTSSTCSCENAYPVGDESGCGDDLPVKACGAGDIAFTVVFCP